ncbi:MAG: hypothetical protein HGA19_24040, partial [Oscillochloris sp.]|nr:hypothetical protein [Oscillochloris sp.]
DPFGATLFSAEFASQPYVWGDIAARSGALGQLFSSFWARFGWMSVTPPAWVLWIYGGLVAASAVGWIMRGRWVAGGRRSEISTRNLWAGPAILLVMALAWIMSFAATAGLVAWQGRMLFPGIGAIGIVLAGGLVKVEGKRQGVLSFAIYLCLAVYMPFGVIAPAYTWVTLAPGQALEGLGTSVYIRYANDWEQGVVLRGWRLDGPVTPSVELPITLTWNSLEPIPRSWTVFIELRNASDQVVTRSESRPRDATLPFTYWTSGDWVADQHRITLPTGLAPGPYRLIVGLYRPEKNNMRLPVWAEDGSAIGDQAEVGEVLVLP